MGYFFFSPPVAGLTNRHPVRDSNPSAPLVLHLKHKLKYFEKKGWEKLWIATAEEIVREEFKKNYAAYAIPKKKRNSPSLKKVILELIYSLISLITVLAH